MPEYSQLRIDKAKKNLTAQLNYGGIFVDHAHTTKHLSLEYEQGDLLDEISQLRRLGEAFAELADALEADRG